mgnify:CR=1 FL=1
MRLLGLIAFAGHTDVVNALAVQNGRLFSAGDDKIVRMFDIQKPLALETLSG